MTLKKQPVVVIFDQDSHFYDKITQIKQNMIEFRWFEEKEDSLRAIKTYSKFASLILYAPKLSDTGNPNEEMAEIQSLKIQQPELPILIISNHNFDFLKVFEWKADGYIYQKSRPKEILSYLAKFLSARGLDCPSSY